MHVVETSRRGSRPERTAYELTNDGETEFLTLLRESLWTVSSYGLDPGHAEGLALKAALGEAEARWAREFIGRIETGAYRFAGEPAPAVSAST